MRTAAVTVVRLYLTEGEGRLDALVARLREQEGVRGLTVFRAIEGAGKSGVLHTASLVDLSLDLPLVIEFFDAPEKVERILEHIAGDFQPGHVLCWSAEVND